MERIKSEHINSKGLFRLNDRLFKQNLPRISQNISPGKENSSWEKSVFHDVKNLPYKANKLCKIPQRFIKHNNKI